MSALSALPRPSVATVAVSMMLAAAIGTGILATIAGLFQDVGAPFEHVVVAERACGDRAFVSERERCVDAYLAAARHRTVASR